VYKVKLDYIDVQERGLKLRPGQRVRLLSDMYFASGYYDSRITRITRNIADPDALSVDISAVRVVGTLSRLQASIQKTENVVAQFSGQLPAIIKSNDDTSADDSSVYTSAKSEKEFLNKRKGGEVAAPVTFDEVAEFLNGLVAHKYIKIGNGYLRYNDELGVWEMVGDLLVTGNVAWFASIKGFKPSTIMDAVQVDGETIVKNELGQLHVIGGGSSGSGGGLTVSDLSNYLTTNKYTKQSDVETLISTALTPYALTAAIPTNNNQLSNGAGYITAAALNGYATQSWVEGKKYLTGITSSQVTTALGYTPYNSSNPDKYIKGIDYDMVIAALGYTPYSTTNPMGYLTISSLLGYATEQWVGDNYLAKSGGTINNIEILSETSINPLSVAGNNRSGFIGIGSYSNGVYSRYGLISFPDVNGSLYRYDNSYNAFEIIDSNNIGSYNAGSATKLATPRTIWGQSFDGSGNVGGVLMNFTQITADASLSYGIFRGDFFSANLTSNDLVIHNPFIGLSGNVAIGDTTADAKLHVHGDILSKGTMRCVGDYGGFAMYAGIRDGEALAIERLANHGGWVGMGITMLNNGDVGIGYTTPQAKLHVGGSIRADYDVVSIGTNRSAGGFNLSDTGVTYCGLMPNRLITSSGQVTDMWLYNNTKITYYASAHEIINDVTINGNLLVNGNVSWISQSQRSLKHIICEQGLSLAQLEQIKPIKFYWKDGRDAALHVGGVADVFDEVLPEVVARNKGVLCLNYVDAAFYVGASLIAPVLDHERRITEGERERKALKKENATLKRELAIMKQMLNQLPA
jgi:hypothetical protein